ncbi:hypothetical protein [Actinocrispum sp. NPDC049592]|uniref:hypothetical protein n=1 Tax=Actinocrispum sp. NPDC049592 TaxID=3154835 RepID=UPI00341B0167
MTEVVANPVTVRLYPLAAEHVAAMLADAVALVVAIVLWGAVGWTTGAIAVVPLLAFVALVHAVQMYRVAVRFDDTAITIIRPWRRWRVEWADVAGLIYSSREVRPATYRLHLVLKGSEPPYGRYLTDAELARYAKGPVVMTVFQVNRCAERVLDELARHGFPAPELVALRYRSPKYTPEEWMRAVAEDLIRSRGDEPQP